MRNSLVCLIAVVASGCPDIDVDSGEIGDLPTVEFDPANRIIPFPNDLLLDRETGLVAIPEGCDESAATSATRELVLNQLDGFGTYETAIAVTFTEPVDAASLDGNVLLLPRVADGDDVAPADSDPIPVITLPATTLRFDPECSTESTVDQVVIVPLRPLDQRTTYVVALTAGIETADGDPFSPSFTWALLREPEPPVVLDSAGNVVTNETPLDPVEPDQLEQLRGIAQLWAAHAPLMGFLADKDVDPTDVLLAWEFTTQTVQDPLDTQVAGSPAAEVVGAPLVGPTGVGSPVPIALALNIDGAQAAGIFPFEVCDTGASAGGVDAPAEADDVQCFLKLALGGGLSCTTAGTCAVPYVTGTGTCAALGCAAIGQVLTGGTLSPQYQTTASNPLTDPVCGPAGNAACPPVPGPWADPIAPEVGGTELLSTFVLLPAAACPVEGCPTIVFGHDLSQSRTTAFAIAPRLAALGFATVAADFVAHGSRAVQISDDADTGCTIPDPTVVAEAHCFSPFLSANLATSRDNIRQSVLDLQTLAASLAACGTDNCGLLEVNPASIQYLGMGLGGAIGSIAAATDDTIKASVLYASAVGWVDIFENTATLEIRCALVDALIDAGVVEGDKLDTSGSEPTGTCVGDEWKTQPAYRQFSAIARWAFDPADPANFTRRLAARTFLLQEVVDDEVIPNLATDREGALTGLAPAPADCAQAPGAPASAAITDMPTANKWVTYADIAPGTTDCLGGNTFAHPTLLRPAAGADGSLGTVRIQTDALTYLFNNR